MAQPGSMAIEALGPVQQRSIGVQPGQSGMQGIRQFAGQPLQSEKVDTGTTDLLMQLGGKVLAPIMEQAQTAAFLDGAQRVAQGEALKDIVDEQPWYTQIFGPTSSVQGARTIAQMQQVDDYLTGIQTDMPELQKLSPTEFAKTMTSRMSSFLTGDGVADAAIQTKMIESMGAVTKAHTKAHYKWTQDTMQKTITSYMISGAKKLQSQAMQLLDGTMSEQDFKDVKAGMLNNLMPLAGQSPESYWGGIEEAVTDALATGNHHAANTVFDSGLLANAPAEVRKKLFDARHTYEARTQETAGFAEYGPIIGQLQGLARAGQLTGDQIVAQVDKINADYAVRYGIDRPLFKRSELVSLISGNISKIYSRSEADARQARSDARADRREALKVNAKAETEARKAAQLLQFVQAGAGDMTKLAGYTGDEINLAVYKGAQIIEQQGGNVGEYLVRQYNNGGEHVNSLYQNKMQAGIRAAKQEGHTGKSFETSYGLYKQLSAQQGGKAAAMAYLGDDGARMMKYDHLVSQGQIPPETAYQLSFGEPLDTTRKSTDKDIAKAIEQVVQQDQPGWFTRTFTSAVELTDQGKRTLTSAVAANYDLLAQNGGLDDSQAMAVALDVAKRDLDVVGKYVYNKGVDREPLYMLIGSDEATAGKVFSEGLANKARASGIKNIDDVNVMITRLPDHNGQGVFGITLVDEDGKTSHFPMTSNELRKQYETGKDFK